MFEVIRSFLFDGATFKRVVSDVAATAGIVASMPPVQAALAALLPGAEWVGPAAVLLGGVYSARARQKAEPPQP